MPEIGLRTARSEGATKMVAWEAIPENLHRISQQIKHL